MSDQKVELGQHVAYISTNGKGERTVRDAIVLGFDNGPEGYDGELPPARLAFLVTDRLNVLNGAEWRHAFDRAFSVPHVSSSVGDRHVYVVPEDANDVRDHLTMLQEEFARLREAHDALAKAAVSVTTTPRP